MEETRTSFEGWAILELMGHRRLAGYVQESTIAGGAFIRIDVPNYHESQDEVPLDPGDIAATQFYAPAAVYCITPTTEEMARITARMATVEPVTEWEARWARPALTAAGTDEHPDEHGF